MTTKNTKINKWKVAMITVILMNMHTSMTMEKRKKIKPLRIK